MADLINAQQLLLPGYQIVLHFRDDSCDADTANARLLQAITDNATTFVALAGSGCSTSSKSLASIAPILRMPHISWSSASAELSNRRAYRTFFRTRVPETSYTGAWVLLARTCGWNSLMVIKGEESRYSFQVDNFVNAATAAGIDLPAPSSVLSAIEADRAVYDIVQRRVRVVVAISYQQSVSYLMCQSIKAKVTGLIILTKLHSSTRWWQSRYAGMDASCTPPALDAAAEGMIMVGDKDFRREPANLTCARGMTSADYSGWWDAFVARRLGTPELPSAHPTAANAADGVCMLALALRGLLVAESVAAEDLRLRTEVAFSGFNRRLQASDFQGVTGHVTFPASPTPDGAGDVALPQACDVIQVQKNTSVLLGSYHLDSNTFTWRGTLNLAWPRALGSCPASTWEDCGPGEEPAGINCRPCSPGHFKSAWGSAECDLCSYGVYADQAGASECVACPRGSFADSAGASSCRGCGYGLVAKQSGTGCEVDPLFLGYGSGVLLSSFFSGCALFQRLRWTRKLKDITVVEDGEAKLVISTYSRHHICHNWRRSPSTVVMLAGTGVPQLDGPGHRHRVRVLSPHRLELLLPDLGPAVRGGWASSKGVLRQPLALELVDTTIFCVRIPTFVYVLALAFAAAALAVAGDLDGLAAAVFAFAGGSAAAACSASLRWWCWTVSRTPMQQKLLSFRHELALAAPAPTPRGCSRAITVQQLTELMDYFRDFVKQRTMYYICENVVKPITFSEQLSYSELVGGETVQWFVSHYWGTPFRDFVETLRKHTESLPGLGGPVPYWVCTFSVNQWKVEVELGSEIRDSSFYHALSSAACKGTVMVMDDQALPLKRVWCLFEVATTYQRTLQDSDFQGLILCARSGVLNRGTADMDTAIQIARQMVKINLRHAEATNEEDKEAILQLVESMDGGFKSVNGFVRSALRSALFQMHAAFEKDFEHVVKTLRGASRTLSRMLSADPSTAERTITEVSPTSWGPTAGRKGSVSFALSHTNHSLPRDAGGESGEAEDDEDDEEQDEEEEEEGQGKSRGEEEGVGEGEDDVDAVNFEALHSEDIAELREIAVIVSVATKGVSL